MAKLIRAGWAALALAGVAAGAATAAEPSAPAGAATPGTLNAQLSALHASTPAAPVADPAASVAVSRQVIDAAAAFQSYMHHAGALSSHFSDGGGVAKALTVAAGYEPAQLERGAIAYGALAALQDSAFVEAVREAAPSPADRDALAARLVAEPAAVLEIPGAEETAARVATQVGRRGGALQINGEAVRKAAYAVQKEAWSKGAIEHASDRLSAVKAMSAAPATLTVADQEELMGGLTALRAWSAAPDASGRATPAVARALAMAALAALGRGGEDHAEDVRSLLADARGLDCLKMAKLNLYQCLAVAGPHYEDMFCMGRHAMADTGQCVTAQVGWSGPLESAPVLVRAVQPLAAPVESVAVPVAMASADGPERANAFSTAALPPPPVEPEPAQLARTDIPSFDSEPRSPIRDDVRDDRYAPRGDEDADPRYAAPPPGYGPGYGYGPPPGYYGYGRPGYDGR